MRRLKAILVEEGLIRRRTAQLSSGLKSAVERAARKNGFNFGGHSTFVERIDEESEEWLLDVSDDKWEVEVLYHYYDHHEPRVVYARILTRSGREVGDMDPKVGGNWASQIEAILEWARGWINNQ